MNKQNETETPAPVDRLVISFFERVCDEADRLVSQREGVHNMHGFRAAVHVWARNYKEGIRVDWQNLDYLLRCMRVCVSSGQFPKRGQVEKRDIISWEQID